jgi:hypothetical protein
MNRTLVQFGRPAGRLLYFLVSLLIVVALRPVSWALPAKATVTDTIYRADGTPAHGTLIITWPAFTSADKSAVAAGSMTVPIGADGRVNLQLVPTEGGLPGVAYKVVVKSTDGTTAVEWWSVPNTTSVPISAIRSKVAPPATIVLNNAQLATKLDRSGDTPVTLAGLRFASKFASVQAAVDDAAQNGAVVVPPDYPGSDTYTTAKAAVLDFRRGNLGVNDIVTQGPKIDVRAFGATGSAQGTTATCTAGSYNVTLANAIDFRNGDGIHLYHCGSAVTLASPTAPAATVVGTPGATTHAYQIAALTDNGGETAASPAMTITTANASMNFANAVLVSWNAVAGARAYAVYKDGLLLNIVGVPGWAQHWVRSRPYHLNEYVQPNTFNGHFYKVSSAVNTISMLEDGAALNLSPGLHTITPKSMAGISAGVPLYVDALNVSNRETVTVTSATATTFTAIFTKAHVHGFAITTVSGASEPNWCTTPGCATADNGIIYTEQPFTTYDVGQGAWGSSPVRTVAYNAPASALSDSLVTTVVSGGGTTSIVLASASASTVTGAKAEHDDTAAIQAASSFAHTKFATEQPYNGAAAAQYGAALYFPYGKYRISSALAPQTSNIYSDGQAVIEQTIPTRNVIDLSNGYMLSIENLGLWGGWDQIRYSNPNSGGIVSLKNLDHENCWDYALNFQEFPTGSNDNHLSTFVNWTNSSVQGCKRLVFNSADQFTADSISASYNEYNNDAAAQFFNLSGGLHISNFFAAPGRQLPGSRWIDNRAGVVIDGNSRFGGEGGGGWPIVYNFAGYDFNPGTGTLLSGLPYNGQRIDISDSVLCIGSGTPNAAVLNLQDSVPAQFNLHNVGCVLNDPIVRNGGGIDLDGYFTDPTTYQLLSPPTFEWRIGPNQIYSGITSSNVPVQLMPYLGRADLMMTAPPASGNWQQGQTIRNAAVLNTGNATGWINLRTGKSAPKWTANTSYAVGQYVVPLSDNGHVYVAATNGTSAATQPVWSAVAKSVVLDGSVTWVEAGAASKWLATGLTACDDGTMLCLTDSTNHAGITVTNGASYSVNLLRSVSGTTDSFRLAVWDGHYATVASQGANDLNISAPAGRTVTISGGNAKYCYNSPATLCDLSGAGAPTGCGTTYASGSTYRRTDGTPGSTFYVCEGTNWSGK